MGDGCLVNFCMVNDIDFPIILLCIYSKDNRFQLKVGTFAQNKSPSTLLEENSLGNWQSQELNSLSAVVVVTLYRPSCFINIG